MLLITRLHLRRTARRYPSLFLWWLWVCADDSLNQLVNDLSARLVANLLNLLDLGISVLLCVLFGLLVA